MNIEVTWKKLALSGTVALAALVGTAFLGARFALAVPGGETRNGLSFAGTLRSSGGAPVTSATTLTFTFRKGSATVCAPSVMVTPDSGGGFVAQIPTDGCPRSLFDGSDVTFDVSSGGNVIAMNQVVNPVPYARYADRVGSPECPTGYERDTSDNSTTICFRTMTLGTATLRDEVVKVGTGSTAFWIDRYEASVHQASTGTQLGTANTTGGAADNIAQSGLSRSGQRPRGAPSPAMALSHPGMPTTNVTWFQANEACAASGKRLPDGAEWLRAASGTIDDSTCNAGSAGARASAPTNACVSASGAHDMIGNVMEVTSDWYASIQTQVSDSYGTNSRWLDSSGANFNGDILHGISSVAHAGASEFVRGLPSASFRGGAWHDGGNAGVFAMHLTNSPQHWFASGGFRCVIPR